MPTKMVPDFGPGSRTLVPAGAFVYRNGLNYLNGLPKWTFIYGFECLSCILYPHNGLQKSQRVENASSE